MRNGSKSKYDPDLRTLDPKINRGSPWVMFNTSVKYHHCQKEMELSCGNGKKFKVEI